MNVDTWFVKVMLRAPMFIFGVARGKRKMNKLFSVLFLLLIEGCRGEGDHVYDQCRVPTLVDEDIRSCIESVKMNPENNCVNMFHTRCGGSTNDGSFVSSCVCLEKINECYTNQGLVAPDVIVDYGTWCRCTTFPSVMVVDFIMALVVIIGFLIFIFLVVN